MNDNLTIADFFIVDGISSGYLGQRLLAKSAGIFEKIMSWESAMDVTQDDGICAALFGNQNAISVHHF